MALKEGIYIYNFIQIARGFLALDLPRKVPVILEENQSSIKVAGNLEFHKRTKHIYIICQYIREKITNKDIEVFYILTKEQIADSLTKSIR